MVFYRLDQGCIVRLLTLDALQCTGNVVFKAMDILNLKSVTDVIIYVAVCLGKWFVGTK